MRVKKTTEQSQGPDFELCGACGAVLEKAAKFCNRCGVRLEPPAGEEPDASDETPEVNAPADEVVDEKESVDKAPIEETSDTDETPAEAEPLADEKPSEAKTSGVKSFCTVCGAALEEGARFCNRCGARVQKPDKTGTPAVRKFCMNCGADVTDVKFCTGCGVAVGEVNRAGAAYIGAPIAAPVAVEESPESKLKKKRIIGGVLSLVGAAFSVILGFIFLCTPFIMATVRKYFFVSDIYSQSGLTLIGAIFGAKSELADVGANSTLLCWAGWLYLVLLIAIINHCVSVALNISRCVKGERPCNVLQSNIAVLLGGLAILIVGCIASRQVGVYFDKMDNLSTVSMSFYYGFVGIFVAALVGFGFVLAGYLYSDKAFPPRSEKVKKTGSVLAIFIVDIVCAVLIAISVIAPICTVLDYNYDKEIKVRVRDSGRAVTVCDERYNGVNIGATVFELDGIEYGEGYVFRIETDDVDRNALIGSIALVYYTDVMDLGAKEIFDVIENDSLKVNSAAETGNSSASLSFTCSTFRYLAIVVNFSSKDEKNVKYDYSLSEA